MAILQWDDVFTKTKHFPTNGRNTLKLRPFSYRRPVFSSFILSWTKRIKRIELEFVMLLCICQLKRTYAFGADWLMASEIWSLHRDVQSEHCESVKMSMYCRFDIAVSTKIQFDYEHFIDMPSFVSLLIKFEWRCTFYND